MLIEQHLIPEMSQEMSNIAANLCNIENGGEKTKLPLP